MALVKFQPTYEKKPLPKREYILIGTLIKRTKSALLIQKANSNCKLWVNLPKDEDLLAESNIKEGDLYNFTVEVATGTDRESSIIRTRLTLVALHDRLNDVQRDHPGFYGNLRGRIAKATQTTISKLWLIQISASDGQRQWLRGFTDEFPKVDSQVTIDFDLSLSSKLVDFNGEIWEDTKNVEYKNKDDALVTKEIKTGYPCLSVTGLSVIGEAKPRKQYKRG